MTKFNVICYRLKENAKPAEILEAIEALIKKHSAFYAECLFKVNVFINEYEFEGKLHSNRNRNSVLTLLRRYPQLEAYYKHTKEEKAWLNISEKLSVCNYSDDDFSCIGEIEYDTVRDIVRNIPKPYSVNDFVLIYNGISFCKESSDSARIRQSKSGFDSPVGNYILYSRSNYGDEKHSYIHFSVDDNNLDTMRELFFEFCEKIPGQYEGTEYHS